MVPTDLCNDFYKEGRLEVTIKQRRTINPKKEFATGPMNDSGKKEEEALERKSMLPDPGRVDWL